MNVLIVEDEGVAARRLTKLLESRDITVVGHCKSNKKLIEFINNDPEPDLYFFDIHLSDGHIFEILPVLNIQSPIIFTTAYQEYAIKAFKQNSIDYLLKPINEEELDVALEKYHKIYGQESSKMDLKDLSELILSQTKNSYKNRILIKVGAKLKSIEIREVEMFYSENKSSYLLTTDGRSYPFDRTIDQIHKELNPTKFFRINRSDIINIDHIKDILIYSNSRLKILLNASGQKEIICARDRVKEFKEWLG